MRFTIVLGCVLLVCLLALHGVLGCCHRPPPALEPLPPYAPPGPPAPAAVDFVRAAALLRGDGALLASACPRLESAGAGLALPALESPCTTEPSHR